ncbi:fam11a b protein [Anaeramoeba ignava]|uniref:Fam11a b protein n=1 Tax=Anaeramoeba ignava TaxID=1746090 RepID=A0A9Q0LBX1_ANAIG|nr:fam11a b protein [Anaeramoeba ignava]
MKNFQLINYKSKPVVKIEREHLYSLQITESSNFGESLKTPPLEENLILEMLPEEILLYIFQYLSPGELIKVGSTCTTLNELSEDKNTWRNISYNYNQFFLFNKVEVPKRNEIYEENRIPICGIIKESQLITYNINSKQKKPEKTNSGLTSLFKRRDQDQDQNQNQFVNEIILFDRKKTEKKLIEYIEKIPNPKEELISKGKLIYNGIKERKQQIEKNLKRKEENAKKWKKIARIDDFLFGNLIFLGIGFVAFIITLNVYIEKKLSSNTIYIFIPLLLPLLVYIVLIFYSLKLDRETTFLVYVLMITVLFIQLLLIGLRADSTIKGSWLLIFLPFFILIGITIIGIIIWICNDPDSIIATLLMIFIMLFLFLMFLGLRLDGKIKWNYGIVFIPLFFINLFPFFMSLSLFCLHPRTYACTIFFSNILIFLFISLPISLIETFIVLFLEVSKFNHITYAFVPLYAIFSCFLCWLFYFIHDEFC